MSDETPDSPAPVDVREAEPLRQIPLSLWTAIGALAVITILVLVAVFTGNIQTYGSQIFVTIVYFAAFIGTLIGAFAIATRSPSFPLPLAILSGVFVIAYGLVLIWVDFVSTQQYGYSHLRGDEWSALSNPWTAFWLLVPLWVVIMVPVVIAWAGVSLSGHNVVLRLLSIAAASLFAVVAVLWFLPVVISRSFGYGMTDFYDRTVAAAWIVAIALAAVYALLLWFFRREERVALRRESPTVGRQDGRDIEGVLPYPAESAGSPQNQAELTPWPFYEDGVTPLPVGVDGLPVFSVLQTFDGRPYPVQVGDSEAVAAIERGRIAAGRC